MMKSFLPKIVIKVPKKISIFLSKENILFFQQKDVLSHLFIQPPVELSFLEKGLLIIKATPESAFLSCNGQKRLRALLFLYKHYISACLNRSTFILKAKIDLKGVGYKVDLLEKNKISFVHFRLGYSHSIFLKVPKNINVCILKTNKFFIFSEYPESYYTFISKIQLLKSADSYKGKGFIVNNKKRALKTSKKL